MWVIFISFRLNTNCVNSDALFLVWAYVLGHLQLSYLSLPSPPSSSPLSYPPLLLLPLPSSSSFPSPSSRKEVSLPSFTTSKPNTGKPFVQRDIKIIFSHNFNQGSFFSQLTDFTMHIDLSNRTIALHAVILHLVKDFTAPSVKPGKGIRPISLVSTYSCISLSLIEDLKIKWRIMEFS